MPSKTTSNRTKRRRGACQSCCPCFYGSNQMVLEEITWNDFDVDSCSGDYEYIIENMRIRAAPKKLLDIPSVHETGVGKKLKYRAARKYEDVDKGDQVVEETEPEKISIIQQVETVKTSPRPQSATKEGRLVCGPCMPLSDNYDPCCRRFAPDERPCGACRTSVYPTGECKPLNEEDVAKILNKPLYEDNPTPIQKDPERFNRCLSGIATNTQC